MRIEIWSDIVCPWCLIGKRRFEKALAQFAHSDTVEVVYRSFLLDPSAPSQPTETNAVHLGRKYGGGEAGGQQMIDRVAAVAAEEGMVWRLSQAMHVGTVDAHRLLHLALATGGAGQQRELNDALLRAYFERAVNVADHDVLRSIAVDSGLAADAVDRVLAGDEYTEAVGADIERAQQFGASGVPFYVFDEKYAVSGAQPVEAFAQILDRVWAESRPAVVSLGEGEACGPDGCTV